MANASEQLNSGVRAAGDVKIDEVVLITSSGEEINIKLYVGELNLYEDMFRTGLYGNLLVVDNFNLTQSFALTGDEFLRLKFSTPSMPDSEIFKTFKVYSITDRMMVNDAAKQSYIMHFCSPEIMIDALSPVHKTFSGTVDDVVKKIFENYIATSRTGGNQFSTLNILGKTVNQVKFTSPGWRPLKCLNWLASRALGSGYKSPGYVFFESNKGFYFANVEQIIDNAIKTKQLYQEYYYFANNTFTPGFNRDSDIDTQYKLAEDFKVVESFNSLKNAQTGYLANRLFTFDIVTKEYTIFDYDHVNNWNVYNHMGSIKGAAIPPYASGEIGMNTLRSPAGFNQVALQHSLLYTGFRNNVHDRASEILPRRLSNLNELQNIKIEITVPGRTDAEIGSMVKFNYPDASPRDPSDLNKQKLDKLYSGYYLVTAIRHRVNLTRHIMIMELVKDSYSSIGNET
jgi:hypothetical protein